MTLESKAALPKGPCSESRFWPFLNQWRKDTKEYAPSAHELAIPPEDVAGAPHYLTGKRLPRHRLRFVAD